MPEGRCWRSISLLLIWAFSKTIFPISVAILRFSALFDERVISPLLGFGYKLFFRLDSSFTSDIIIARSGALTLSELAIVSKPSILIPSPNVAEDHQLKNAKSIEEKDACICIEEKDLDLIFKNKLDLLLNDKNLRDELSYNMSQIAMPNASYDIVDLIKKHLKND